MIRPAGIAVALLAFAASSPLFAQTALDRLEAKLEGAPAARPSAETARPQLGLMADERNPRAGVLVYKVLPDSPAQRAGFQERDRIIEIDGRIIRSNADIAAALNDKRLNDRFEATVLRDGEAVLVLTIFLGDPRTVRKPIADDLPPPRGVEMSETPSLGVTLTPLKPGDATYPDKQGAVIRSIVVGSIADKFKLPLGGLIVGVDGKRVVSPDDVVAAIRGVKAGQEVELTIYNREVLSRRKVVFNDAAAAASGSIVEAAKPSPDATAGGKSALDLLEDRLTGGGSELPAPKIPELPEEEPKAPAVDDRPEPPPLLVENDGPRADPLKGFEIDEPEKPAETDDAEVVRLRKRVDELEERIRSLEALLKTPQPAE